MSALPSTADAAAFVRLTHWREQRARREHVERRDKRDAAQAQVDARRDELAAFDARIVALHAAFAAADATTLVRCAAYALARREDLAYRRERCEYELIDDEETLADAQRALADAAQRWNAAHARAEAAFDLRRAARREAARAAELALEREAPTPHDPRGLMLAAVRPTTPHSGRRP